MRGTATANQGGIAEDFNQAFAKVETDGFAVNGVVAKTLYKSLLRGARDANGQQLADIAGGELVLRRARPGRPHQAHKTATSRVRAALAEDPTLGPTELAQIAGCSVGHASKIKGAL